MGKKSAKQAFSDTVEFQTSLLETQASLISRATLGVVSPEGVLRVTRDAPMAVINRAASLASGAATLGSSLRQRFTGSTATETKQ